MPTESHHYGGGVDIVGQLLVTLQRKVVVGRGDRDKLTGELWRALEVVNCYLSNMELLSPGFEDYNNVIALENSEPGMATTCQHTKDHQ